MFSHDPLTEETRELLDKVMSGGSVATTDRNQELCLQWTWLCSPPSGLCTGPEFLVALIRGWAFLRKRWGLCFCLQGELKWSHMYLISSQGNFHLGGYIKGVLPGVSANISCDFLVIL